MSDDITCPNCGSSEFYRARSGGKRWGVGPKWICTKCGFKGTRDMMTHGNIKKQQAGW
jgi:predicted RNA-binding Zn-ribbon protein involved in translation (DUF1610 family)